MIHKIDIIWEIARFHDLRNSSVHDAYVSLTLDRTITYYYYYYTILCRSIYVAIAINFNAASSTQLYKYIANRYKGRIKCQTMCDQAVLHNIKSESGIITLTLYIVSHNRPKTVYFKRRRSACKQVRCNSHNTSSFKGKPLYLEYLR